MPPMVTVNDHMPHFIGIIDKRSSVRHYCKISARPYNRIKKVTYLRNQIYVSCGYGLHLLP